MKDDMILDMDNFDFSTLDMEESKVSEPKKTDNDFYNPEIKSTNFFDDDDDDFDDDDEFLDDDDAEDGEDDGVDHELSPEDVATKFAEIPDDFELMVGDVKATKGQIVEHVKNIEEFNSRKGQLDTYFQSFENIDKQMNEQFIRAYTETELKLNSYRTKLRSPDLMDSERGMIYRDIEKLEMNRNLINENVEKYSQQRRQRDEYAEQARLNETNVEMTKRYGNDWVNKMAPTLTQYIVDSGIASPEIRKALSPSLLELVIKAQKYDTLQKSSTDKVNSRASGKKTRSTTSNSSKKATAKSSKESAILRKWKSGQIDSSEMFKYLQD